MRSTKEIKVHVFFFLFFFHCCLLLLLFCSGRSTASAATSTTATTRVGSNVRIRICKELLGFLDLLEVHVDVSAKGCNVLQGIGKHVWHGSISWNSYLTTECSHVRNTGQEFGNDDVVTHLQNCSREDSPILDDKFDFHTIFEWLDVQFCQQSCCTCRYLCALNTCFHVCDNLNLTLDNLRGNIQRLEHSCLRRVHSCRSRWDNHIARSIDASLSVLGHTVLQQNFLDKVQRAVLREDKADVSID